MLPAGDRRAVLAKLSQAERAQVRAKLHGATPRREDSPWSADIANRLGKDNTLTALGRAALARAAAAHRPTKAAAPESLFDALVARFRLGAR